MGLENLSFFSILNSLIYLSEILFKFSGFSSNKIEKNYYRLTKKNNLLLEEFCYKRSIQPLLIKIEIGPVMKLFVLFVRNVIKAGSFSYDLYLVPER